ncbi:MAG TPA: hypothetical protein VKA44_01360 [Gemmatimonadota bacterium]|nr:hypothetical protein [Gemmatimonadota bacterium]
MKVLKGSIALALACGLAAGCGGKGGGNGQASGGASQGGSMPARDSLPPAVRVQLDSGNAAYRAGDYGEAMRHYRATIATVPDLASGWFGVYMAATAMGDSAAADSAKARMGDLGGAASAHMVPHGGASPHGMGMPAGTTGATPRGDTT